MFSWKLILAYSFPFLTSLPFFFYPPTPLFFFFFHLLYFYLYFLQYFAYYSHFGFGHFLCWFWKVLFIFNFFFYLRIKTFSFCDVNCKYFLVCILPFDYFKVIFLFVLFCHAAKNVWFLGSQIFNLFFYVSWVLYHSYKDFVHANIILKFIFLSTFMD